MKEAREEKKRGKERRKKEERTGEVKRNKKCFRR